MCGTEYEKNKLADYGITADVAVLPLAEGDLEKLQTDLPQEFTVLVALDKPYAELLKNLEIDLPHIKFIYNSGKMKDFSCYLSFYQFAALDTAMLTAHVNGRNVISNVQAPYCGFIDPDQTYEKFKADLYEKIRETRPKQFNKGAQAFYLNLAEPDSFRRKIASYSAPKLEVIA